MATTTATRRALLCAALALAGCAAKDNRATLSETYPSEVGSYATYFCAVEDTGFVTPGDSVFVWLYQYSDSIVQPPIGRAIGGPQFSIERPSPVTIQLVSADGRRQTRPIKDTLVTGNYFFMAHRSSAPAGMYSARIDIDGQVTVQEYPLLK